MEKTRVKETKSRDGGISLTGVWLYHPNTSQQSTPAGQHALRIGQLAGKHPTVIFEFEL